MNPSEKRYTDPLFDKINDPRARAEKARVKVSRRGSSQRSSPPSSGGGTGLRNALLAGVCVLIAAVGYFLWQAQDQITRLNVELSSNQERLTEVTTDLQDSRQELTRLNTGLSDSQSRLQSQGQDLQRYKGLYENLKDAQEHQNLELQALNLEKANQTDVAVLRDQTAQIQSGVEEVSGAVGDLKETTAQNATRIEQATQRLDDTDVRLGQVETNTSSNAEEIAAVRRSMERDYYNFELQEKGAYMKVQEVSFRLTDIDFNKRLYDLDVLADGKVIRQRDRAINEPIYFFREGQKRPYEVVVTRIDRDLVVGYLGVPKAD